MISLGTAAKLVVAAGVILGAYIVYGRSGGGAGIGAKLGGGIGEGLSGFAENFSAGIAHSFNSIQWPEFQWPDFNWPEFQTARGPSNIQDDPYNDSRQYPWRKSDDPTVNQIIDNYVRTTGPGSEAFRRQAYDEYRGDTASDWRSFGPEWAAREEARIRGV